MEEFMMQGKRGDRHMRRESSLEPKKERHACRSRLVSRVLSEFCVCSLDWNIRPEYSANIRRVLKHWSLHSSLAAPKMRTAHQKRFASRETVRRSERMGKPVSTTNSVRQTWVETPSVWRENVDATLFLFTSNPHPCVKHRLMTANGT